MIFQETMSFKFHPIRRLHCGRGYNQSEGFIYKSGLLFEDLERLLLPEILLLVIVHLKPLLALVELMQLVCDGDPGASQRQAYLNIP